MAQRLSNATGGGRQGMVDLQRQKFESPNTIAYPTTVFGKGDGRQKFLVRDDGLPPDKNVSDKINNLNM